MLNTNLTQKAFMIAQAAHEGQVDKSGSPYINHPCKVAESMTTEEETLAALLHNVIEETDVTIEYLIEEGIPSSVIETLKLLTHDDETPYLDYVKKIKSNQIAKKVKLADLNHNSDITRIKEPEEWDYKRIEKYNEAINSLE